jgi:myo-inositol 2-dehydrogenase/D-chiro-inositol 1-dehydrogenase
MPVDVAILGAGHMGRTHAEILAGDARARLVAVVDPDRGRASALAEQHGATPHASLTDFLAAGSADAVYVTTPNTMHFDAVTTALDAGLDVFCEKPLTTDLQEAAEILRNVRAGTQILQVGFNRRFAPVYKLARREIEAGFTPYTAAAKLWRGELQEPPWTADVAVTGGFLYESTIHMFDMLRWLFGEVAEIVCRAESNLYEQVDDFSILLTFRSGRHCTLSSSAHATWARPFERLELAGDHGQIVTEELETVRCTRAVRGATEIHDYGLLPIAQKWGYAEADALFLTAVAERSAPPVGVEDGYRAVELCDAAYRSARAGGEPVRVGAPAVAETTP